ncbi:uncharacterized protein LOC109838601 [Asparagus officinalis]|uniref:uncharacterized protein LOC109838601 n=1 Tax=Asparagus officinalis TaxID=4686 RepID=UPI00098DE71E|nr:uncharacterized protein LOC109838601 [Asparagus officinalis]
MTGHGSWKHHPTRSDGGNLLIARRQARDSILKHHPTRSDGGNLLIVQRLGRDRSNNDINVLQSSYLFDQLAQGISPPANYSILGKNYDTGYYLADGIYPKWSTLVQTISQPQGPKRKLFAAMQEGYRKDVERAFGVLQSRFAIIKGPSRFWDKRRLHDIMTACIILHNMTVEDERDAEPEIIVHDEISKPEEIDIDDAERFQRFLDRHRKIQDREAHFMLRNALIEHLWQKHGNEGM